MRPALISKIALLAALFAAPVVATPIVGTPVGAYGSTGQVGNVSSDGTIQFYIPLNNRTDVYGMSGGTSSDSCSTYAGTCTGGSLEMMLYFESSHHGSTEINLDFGDLDVSGVNDPWFFVESLLIRDGLGNVIAVISSLSDLTGGDKNMQYVSFEIQTDGAIYIGLVMNSSFADGTPNGRYRNTAETVRATAVSVPEPETLALLGIGLLVLAVSRRRRTVKDKLLFS